ncbi:MAG TPA: hypothetical protein VJA94_21860 [Candidatus Angelobacter sp.]
MARICLAVTSLIILGLSLPACVHPTQLDSIDVRPSAVTIVGTGANATAQFIADGHFIHPTETRDITTQVTWTSTFSGVASIDKNGLATSGNFCGITTITATAGNNIGVPFTPKAITFATATFTVALPGVMGCPQM